jgi:peptidoglycan/xylan/chitin deacetylase (PgdA/CDA1 family)
MSRENGRVRPLVLCYHAVSDGWSHQLSVRPATFEQQLSSLLRRGFRGVGAEPGLDGDRRGVHVTFDDAFRSVANALPVLERLRIPATVFACAAHADEGRPLDVPELAAEAAAHPEELATMGWEELRSLVERGVEIGSHTVSHPHLPRLTDAEIEQELADSRTRLEEGLGRPCRILAYPYGEHDERVRVAAARVGYAAAFALASTAIPRDPFALSRVDLYRRDSIVSTTLKTSFLRRPAAALRRVVRPE